jgi:copper transport protein
MLADAFHVVAAALWTGGLAFVALALLSARDERWPLAARVVPRFSKLAVGSVAVLLVAGIVNGFLEIRTWRGLWETRYGVLLLVKIGLVLPLLALGLYNNRYAVPRLRAQIATVLEQRRFLRVVGAELILVAAIVGVTAVLVAAPPAKTEIAPKGPFTATTAIGHLQLELVVEPARAGRNTIDLHVRDHAGRPTEVAEARVAATLPAKAVGPLRYRAHHVAGGHYRVHGAELLFAGDWKLRIELRLGEFELLTARPTVPIH